MKNTDTGVTLKTNRKIFCRLWQKYKNEPMIFISSNSGTGKTTYFKWLFIRRALENKEYIDFFYRFETDLEEKFNADKFLTAPKDASKRLLKLIEKVDIFKDRDNSYFLINKITKERIGQGLAVNTQRKIKSTENPLFTRRALFDEIMPDDNVYCPNEVYKFSRLIDSRMRYRDYQVIGLYNKTNPYFPYYDSFYKAGAKFINFVAEKFGTRELKGLQLILSKSDYGEIYNFNSYYFYKEFYKNFNDKGFDTVFYININNYTFAFKDCVNFYILKRTKKVKKNREIFSLGLAGNENLLIDRQNGIIQILINAISRRLIFVNNKKHTIFVKELADFCNIVYNI